MKFPKEQLTGIIPTANKKGFMFTELSFVCEAFIEYVKDCQQPVMDIACAYGITTLPALANSTCDMYALDLAQEHLDVLVDNVSENQRARLHCQQGYFPKDFHFESGSIDAIHCGNVLHFLRGHEIEAGLKACFDWLAPGGKLFVNNGSIYFSPFLPCLPEYERRAEAGERWPGEIENFGQYLPEDVRNNNPEDFIHVFKLEDFEKVLKSIGFEVEESRYYDLTNLKYQSDGIGWVGAIAVKPE